MDGATSKINRRINEERPIYLLPAFMDFSPQHNLRRDFHAKVIHIADGDTITVLNAANKQIKIRLNGIDCPEQAQAYGNKAKQFTKVLVHKEMVVIQAYGTAS